jgi:hypothetical protein
MAQKKTMRMVVQFSNMSQSNPEKINRFRLNRNKNKEIMAYENKKIRFCLNFVKFEVKRRPR